MEPMAVNDDSSRMGDNSAEAGNTTVVKDQSNQSTEQVEQESGSKSVASSLVDSLKSTAKSATGLIPSLVLGSKDHTEGEILPATNEAIDTDVEKKARASQSKVGEEPPRADEVMEESSPGGTVTNVTAEGWSVVDRFPEGEAEEKSMNSTSVQGEEERPKSGDPSLSKQAHRFSSQTVSEPEITEEDSHATSGPSGHADDSHFVPASFLRRRPRSSSEGTKDDDISTVTYVGARISPSSEGIDIAAIAENSAAFEPRKDALLEGSGDTEGGSQVQTEDGASTSNADISVGSKRRKPRPTLMRRKDHGSVVNFVGAHVSRSSESIDIAAIAERPEAFEPQRDSLSGALGNKEAERQLQNEDADSVSKAGSSNDLRRAKNLEFGSGYDLELRDDDNDVSSASSRDANHGTGLGQRKLSQPEEGSEEVVASSSDVEGATSVHDTRQRRGVYRMPGSEAEGEDNGGQNPPQVLVEPAGLVVRAIEFQINLIVHMLAIGIWLINFTFSTLSHPITSTVQVKDKVTSVTAGAANQVLEVFSCLGEGISHAGPSMSKLSKKTFWICLGVAYVIFMLGLLLIPALFVDIIIVNGLVEKPLAIQQPLDFDFTLARPVAVLPLFPPKEIERIKNLPPEKVVKTRVIPLGCKFLVTVTLTLPESDYNMKLGMFQVTAELLSARDQVILRASKPCRLRFRSFPIQLVKTLVFAVPHLVGLSKEAQTIKVRVLEAQEKATPTASVRILIEPKAAFRDEGGVPEIYEAVIRLETILPWPRALISSWKWLFFLWNGVCLFLVEVAFVLCCCRQVLIPSFVRKSVAEEEIVQGQVKDERAIREAPRHVRSSRKGRTNRRVYFEDDTPEAGNSRPEENEDS
ncbi:unnamed protein product [Calypogeia fissa]